MDLVAELMTLSMPDRLAAVKGGVLGPLDISLRAYARGELGERELIAIALTVARTFSSLPPDLSRGFQAFGADAERSLLARLAELEAAN